jgi:hypothetical protein
MPPKDAVVKEVIQEVIGTSLLEREKIIVKVQKKHPHLGHLKLGGSIKKKAFPYTKGLQKSA